MDWIQVQTEIEALMVALDRGIDAIVVAGNDAGNKPALYDKAIAIAEMKLRAGVEVELDGVKTKDPPVTILKDIAKGLCWQEREDMDMSDKEYKRVCRKLDSIKTKISALQSINKQHEQMAKSGG